MIGLILAAAGSGTRFGGAAPKQFQSIDGKAVYLHSLEKLAAHCERVALVVPAGWEERARSDLARHPVRDRTVIATGGETRQDSVHAGLRRLGRVETVLVHDAVRPWLSDELIRRVLEGVARAGACIPGLPISETVKRVNVEGHIVETLERRELRLAQTPQGFDFGLLKTALEKAMEQGYTGTDEAALVERLGKRVLVVEGDPKNIKITWPRDLERAVRSALAQSRGAPE